jgi:uncharacterized protein YcbK (DUF882 family)
MDDQIHVGDTYHVVTARGHGVARHSLHMQAMAIDIRVPGVPIEQLRMPP